MLIKCQYDAVLKSDLWTLFKLFKSQKYVFQCNLNVFTTFECEFKCLLQHLNPI